MKCAICEQYFISQRSFIYHLKKYHHLDLEKYYVLYKNVKEKNCKYCGEKASFDTKNHIFKNICSNRSCIGKYAKECSDKSIKEKYGVTNISQTNIWKEKVKKTKLERYGDENYNNIEKNKETCLKRYGVDNVSKREDIKEIISIKNRKNKDIRLKKMIETLNNDYGVSWNSKDPSICEQIHKTLKESRNQILYEKLNDMNLEIINSYKDKSYDLKCNDCGNITYDVKRYNINRNYKNKINTICKVCHPQTFRSNLENEVAEYISFIYDKGINLNKKIDKYEIDIFLPEEKLGIEINGLYWHSELYKDANYHKEKKIYFANKGINIIYIWEDDWNNSLKKNIILSRINQILNKSKRIYARKCEIYDIKSSEAKSFLEYNHLNGYVGSTYKLGLYYNNELVMVSTFGKRYKNTSYELLRNASKQGYSVIGGFSKLIKYFTKKISKDLYSYVDCDWSSLISENAYSKSGFKMIHHTAPSYYWVINGERRNRTEFQKWKLVKQGADPNLTEEEILHSMDSYRVYNAGNLKYIYNTNPKSS